MLMFLPGMLRPGCRAATIRRFCAALLCLAVLSGQSSAAQAASAPPPAANRTVDGSVCLTIDDGNSRQAIQRDLDALKAQGVHCTFFVIGSCLRANSDLWRRAVKEGHEVCYHSMHHDYMGGWSDARIAKDLDDWNRTAREVLKGYTSPKLARLPGGSGSSNQRILRLFESKGYQLVLWNVDTFTGAIKNHRSISAYIKGRTQAGSIILTHFTGQDAAALNQYLGWLKSHFTLTTVSRGLQQPVKRKPGPLPPPPVIR